MVSLALVAVQFALAEVPVVRFNAADQAAAKAAVLKLADFGAGGGWKGGLEKNAKAFAEEDCPGLFEPKQADLVITGVAKSKFDGAGARVTSGAQIYKTARMAELDWDRTVVNPAYLTCARRRAASDETPNFRFVSMKRLAFPRLGQRTVRLRMIVDYTPEGGSAPVRLLVDAIAFGRGRTGVAISFTAAYKDRAVVDAAEVRLARLLAGRIRT